jgi:hypothetical protein
MRRELGEVIVFYAIPVPGASGPKGLDLKCCIQGPEGPCSLRKGGFVLRTN